MTARAILNLSCCLCILAVVIVLADSWLDYEERVRQAEFQKWQYDFDEELLGIIDSEIKRNVVRDKLRP